MASHYITRFGVEFLIEDFEEVGFSPSHRPYGNDGPVYTGREDECHKSGSTIKCVTAAKDWPSDLRYIEVRVGWTFNHTDTIDDAGDSGCACGHCEDTMDYREICLCNGAYEENGSRTGGRFYPSSHGNIIEIVDTSENGRVSWWMACGETSPGVQLTGEYRGRWRETYEFIAHRAAQGGPSRVIITTSPVGNGTTTPKRRVIRVALGGRWSATLTATPKAGSKFIRWSNGSVKAVTVVSGSGIHGETVEYYYEASFTSSSDNDPPVPGHDWDDNYRPVPGETGCHSNIVVYTSCNPDGVATTSPNKSYHGNCGQSISVSLTSAKNNDEEYADYVFDGWTGDGGITDPSSENTSATLVFPADGENLIVSYVANYRDKNKWKVITDYTPRCMCPGAVAGGGEYDPGRGVHLVAENTGTGKFLRWEISGLGSVIVSSDPYYSFQLPSGSGSTGTIIAMAVFEVTFPNTLIIRADAGVIYTSRDGTSILRNGDDFTG